MMTELNNSEVTINTRKFDGKIHRSWKANLIEKKNSLLTFVGKFEKEVIHPKLGTIICGTISYEYYWLDRWHNIFLFKEPDGRFRNFYCNINMPPTFEKNVLNYIDLDIDILVWKDFSYEILDEDEFIENATFYKYPSKIKNKVYENVSILEKMLKNKDFPFDKETS